MGLFNLFKKGGKQLPPIPNTENKSVKVELGPNFGRVVVDKNERSTEYIPEEGLTIFLWSQNGKEIKKDSEYPRYLTTNYGIGSASKFHKEVIEAGYLEKPTFLACLNKYKVNELKEIAKEWNIPVKGIKKDIILELNDSASDNQKQSIVANSKIYGLSPKGSEYLNAHQEYVIIHQHQTWNITKQVYDACEKKMPSASMGEIFLEAALIQAKTNLKENLRMNSVLFEYKTVYEVCKTFNLPGGNKYLVGYAYSQLNWVCLFDYYYQMLKSKVYSKKELLEEYQDNLFFTPHIIGLMHDIVSFCGDTDFEELKNLNFAWKICTIDMFYQILNEIQNNAIFDSDKWNDILNRRVKECIKRI